MNVSWTTSLSAVVLAAAIGCGSSQEDSSSNDFDAVAEMLEQQAEIDQANAEAKAAAEAQAAADAKAAAARKLAEEGASEIRTDDMVRGSRMTRGGALQTVLKSGIRGQQKLNMMTYDYALKLFEAENGRRPNSHEEFMEKIIRFNNITLEPLQEPYEYWYDADEGQLYKRVKPEAIEAANAEAEAAQPE
ncbi:MAG: hypothetical protein AAF266_11830 [Planctomycetota bacterium]